MINQIAITQNKMSANFRADDSARQDDGNQGSKQSASRCPLVKIEHRNVINTSRNLGRRHLDICSHGNDIRTNRRVDVEFWNSDWSGCMVYITTLLLMGIILSVMTCVLHRNESLFYLQFWKEFPKPAHCKR